MKMSEKFRIGTSGWNYKHWREIFYPPKTPVSRWLDFYAENFDTVEVNATFYRLPKPETFDNWHNKTPENFLLAVKASKYITHIKRLKDCKEPLKRLYNSVKRLRKKLGPILFQLPPNLPFNLEILTQFCYNIDKTYQHVLEVREASWIDNRLFKILKEHNIALCISDTAGKYPFHEEITADFSYIRLHGSKKLYTSKYSEDELQQWAKKIRKLNMTTYIYFDNDFHGFAVKNARRFKEILTRPSNPEQNFN